jgi:hypothetical protein
MDGGGAPGNPSGVTVFSLTGEGMSRDGRLPPWNADIRASAVAACREEVVLARWGRPSGLLCFPPPPRRRAGHLGPKDTAMLFPRDTADPEGDLMGGFSGYSGTWCATREDALDWRRRHPHDAIPPGLPGLPEGTAVRQPGMEAVRAGVPGRRFIRTSGADGEDCFRV